MGILDRVRDKIRAKKEVSAVKAEDKPDVYTKSDDKVYKNDEVYIGRIVRRTPNRQYCVAHVIKGKQLGQAALLGKGGNLVQGGVAEKDAYLAKAMEAWDKQDMQALDAIASEAQEKYNRAGKDEKVAETNTSNVSQVMLNELMSNVRQ